MSYQVIARKFRPTTFDEVIGQDAVVKTLKNAIKSERLSHAFLFCGLRGTGKTTLARILAKTINCEKLLPSIDPCGSCKSCLSFGSNQNIDFIEIDGASHRGIEDVKSLIDTIAYSSSCKYKVILIDEVHMLTKEAFNALLKTLEEPPEHVKFIFATTEPHKLLPTILSRCQRYDLSRISPTSLSGKLKKIAQTLDISVEEPVFELICERSEGSARDAESLFERLISGSIGSKLSLELAYELLGFFQKDLLKELDLAIYEANLKQVFVLAEKLLTSGKDAKLFFEQFRQHLRHIICYKLKLDHFAKNDTASKSSIELYTLNEASYLIEILTQELKSNSLDKRLDVEALLMLLVQSKNRINLSDIVEKLEELAKAEPVTLSNACTLKTEPKEPVEEIIKKTQAVLEEAVDEQAQLGVGTSIQEEQKPLNLKNDAFYDTVMQFAAVELEGSLKK